MLVRAARSEARSRQGSGQWRGREEASAKGGCRRQTPQVSRVAAMPAPGSQALPHKTRNSGSERLVTCNMRDLSLPSPPTSPCALPLLGLRDHMCQVWDEPEAETPVEVARTTRRSAGSTREHRGGVAAGLAQPTLQHGVELGPWGNGGPAGQARCTRAGP